jgi:hypothetical protein
VEASISIITDHSASYSSTSLYLPIPAPEKIFFAGTEIAWQDEPLPSYTDKTDRNWQAVRDYRDSLDNESPIEKAHRYYAKYPKYPPDRFHTTGAARTRAAKRALQPTGWGTKLFQQLGYPYAPAYFYSPHMWHLGLPVDYSDARFIYYPLIIAEIKKAIAALIPRPYAWKIEVGNEGAVHPHIIGGYSPKLAHLIFEGSRVVERVYEPFGLLRYLSKPAAPFTATNYAIYLEAKQSKQTAQLPRLSGQLGLKKLRQRIAA